MLVSGKVNRKALGRPDDLKHAQRAVEPPVGPLEEKLLAFWSAVFAPQNVSVLDNFFDDLGGHSLKAARMVSLARSAPALANLSIQDLYQAQTIRLLAKRLETAPRQGAAPAAKPFHEVPRWRRAWCVAAQSISNSVPVRVHWAAVDPTLPRLFLDGAGARPSRRPGSGGWSVRGHATANAGAVDSDEMADHRAREGR